MKVKAPEDVKEYIRSKFVLSQGEVVYKRNTDPKFGSYAKFNSNTYSKGYVKDVLEGKDPDLSGLFEQINGTLFRSNDPVWGTRKGTEVTKSGAIVCGVKVSSDGSIREKPGKPKESTQKKINYYEAVEVPEHVKRFIEYKFKLKDGVVIYKHRTTPSGNPLKLDKTNIAGHRYAYSYVLAVLKGEKPNLELLFTIQNGYRIRNDDAVWGIYKNKKSSKSFYSTCGEIVPVNVEDSAITRPPEFEWLADMVRVETPGSRYSYAYLYEGNTALAHRINGVIYSAGFITSMKAGEVTERPPIPAYLFRRVRLDFGDGSYVTMTSDDEV